MIDANYWPMLGTVMLIAVGMAISPGQDFALVSRNAMVYSRRAGVWASFGIATAVWLHVAYCITGVALLVASFPRLYVVIRWTGAAYLVYLGIQSLFRSTAHSEETPARQRDITDRSAFGAGFLCNALNPKTTLFFLSIFTQLIKPATPISIQLLCGLIISLAHLAWFGSVAFWLSTPRLQAAIWRFKPWIERAVGTVLICLAAHLVY
ncbi:LysE family translocator [Salinisphaera sp. RV14]|uniref:LysE family translocator n=1 Tax=Salinisphaera sp. RV14 TaxID=3454140 RepID=UPI003F87C69F